jgi:hypothetical protein
MHVLIELWTWLTSLDAPFAFLLALPFVVGALGAGTLVLERRRRGAAHRSSSPIQRGGRPAPVQ